MLSYGLYFQAAYIMLDRFFCYFLFLSFLIAKVNTPMAFAVTTPDFPACSNPTDILKVEHNEGTHGVAGSTAEYKGKDSVYNVNDTQVLQCLCTEDGEGIQTNWWKISSLNDSEIQTLKNRGWYYVPNGALWGLDSAPYMAYNSRYACKGGVGGGEVLGSSTKDILGLAATGNKAMFYSLFGISIGLIFLLLGFLLLRREKK